jgi:hypothetical protein
MQFIANFEPNILALFEVKYGQANSTAPVVFLCKDQGEHA